MAGLALIGCAREASDASSKVSTAQQRPVAPPASATVTLNGRPVTLEVAATETARQLGLRFRPSLPPDGGMILAFPTTAEHPLSMDGVSLPLDVVALDARGTVLDVRERLPGSAGEAVADRPSRYQILLPRGAAGRAGLKPGDAVALPADLTAYAAPTVTLGGRPFQLEVASTDALREHGLMDRDALAADAGMAFVFADEQPRRFWMKNTRIPLDIVYLDAGGRVVSVRQMAPFDLTGVPSGGPAKYAIELNAGTAARVGLKAGDAVALPPMVRNPPELE